MSSHLTKLTIAPAVALALAGCASLPYSPKTGTTVAGAAVGAALGAEMAEDEDEKLGAVVGAVLGAAAGYVIGAKTSWFAQGNEKAFDRAVNNALANPATVEDVYGSYDADLNNDGLVTQDELIALAHAGLSANEIINRLQATNQIFYLTYEQRQSLLEAGVPPEVVYRLEEINQA